MMAAEDDPEAETYNPWSIVNLVFTHLADQGLHPILGESGDPGAPAAACCAPWGSSRPPRATARSCATSGPTWPRSAWRAQ